MDADQANTDVSLSPSCPGCRGAAKRIADLESRLILLEQKLAAATRSGKRQAAPFSKGPPKAAPKKPGRKNGNDYGTQACRAIPPQIDEVLETPLPDHC